MNKENTNKILSDDELLQVTGGIKITDKQKEMAKIVTKLAKETVEDSLKELDNNIKTKILKK